MNDTLILNADAQPISMLPLTVESWKEAIKLFWIGRAEVLHEYDRWVVCSPSVSLKVPAVIILKEYVSAPRDVSYSRENILLRDEYRCQYCGSEHHHNHSELTLDHVIPRFHGGKSTFNNIVASCASCNLEKSHFLKMKPNIKPRKPTYYELVNKMKKFPLVIGHESWNHYLRWDEDKIILKNNLT